MYEILLVIKLKNVNKQIKIFTCDASRRLAISITKFTYKEEMMHAFSYTILRVISSTIPHPPNKLHCGPGKALVKHTNSLSQINEMKVHKKAVTTIKPKLMSVPKLLRETICNMREEKSEENIPEKTRR